MIQEDLGLVQKIAHSVGLRNIYLAFTHMIYSPNSLAKYLKMAPDWLYCTLSTVKTGSWPYGVPVIWKQINYWFIKYICKSIKQMQQRAMVCTIDTRSVPFWFNMLCASKWGSSWSWSYGSWSVKLVYISCCELESRWWRGILDTTFIHYVIKFFSDLSQVGGFLRVLGFPPPKKNWLPWYNWNIVESGVNHHKPTNHT